MAVRTRPGNQRGANGAGGAWPVLHDHPLPESLGQRIGDQACHKINATPGCVWGDDPDGLGGVLLPQRDGGHT